MSHCLNAGGMGRIDYETETMIVTSGVVSPTLRAGGNKTGGDRPPGTDVDTCETLVSIIPFDTTQITSSLNYSNPKAGDPCHPLAAGAHPPAITFNSNAQPDEMKFDEHVSAPLTCSQYSAVAFAFRTAQTGANGIGVEKELAYTLDLASARGVSQGMRVRRLTPMECERLQGFPDRYTAIPKAKDGPRYKALGNSMAVPVMRWIGQSIDYAMIWSTP